MENSLSLLQLAGLWVRGRVFRDRASKWDHQYASGRWEKLKIPAERGRFVATARLLTRHGPPSDVLEIGCGEALLQQQLNPADYRSWVGVDISEVAIQRAQFFASRQVRYQVADMELFDTGDRFDTIVFTESIYYSADPTRLLERYIRFLKPGGRFIVSIFRTKRSDRIWAGLHTVATPIDSLSTSNELGTWECKVMVPQDASGAGLKQIPDSSRSTRATAPENTTSLLSRLVAFFLAEGDETETGFHFAPGRSRDRSASTGSPF